MFRIPIILVPLLALHSYAQSVTAVNHEQFAHDAHAAYYSLPVHGLKSYTCQVVIDWSTVPSTMHDAIETYKLQRAEDAIIQVTVADRTGAQIKHEYPKDVSAEDATRYDHIVELYLQLVNGFLQTWLVKGMDGPVPWSKKGWSVRSMSAGYQVHLDTPDITLITDKEYRVSEIVSKFPDQTIEEHPVFAPSADGLLFVGNDAINTSQGAITHINFATTFQTVQGFQLFHTVHLKVNENIDTRFSFENCSAIKSMVLNTAPSPNK